MRTSIGFRFIAAFCATILFISANGFLQVSVRAEDPEITAKKAAEKAVADALAKEEICKKLKKAAEDAQAAAEAAQKAADDAKKAAEDAQIAADDAAKHYENAKGTGEKPEDKAAAEAADAADQAANKGEFAKDIAQQKQQEADDAKAKAKASGKQKDKDEAAAKQKEADAAKAQADEAGATETAGDKESEAADKAADAAEAKEEAADKSGGVGLSITNSRKKNAREARRRRRATAQAARAAKRDAEAKARAAKEAQEAAAAALEAAKKPCDDAEKARAAAEAAVALFEQLLEKKKVKTGGSSETRKDEETLDGLKKDLHSNIVHQGNGPTVDTKIANGLNVVTFNMPSGRIVVNLPDDIRAGDTISGTVFIEPKGNTDEEKAKNQSVLSGMALDLEGTKIKSEQPSFSWVPPPNPTNNPRNRYQLKLFEVLTQERPSSANIPLNPKPRVTTLPSGAVITGPQTTEPPFSFPNLGQAGKPIIITGSFDGNSSNTTVNWMLPKSAELPNTQNASGALKVLAESPGSAVLAAPSTVNGPIELRLKEGDRESTGTYRNLGVKLSAPKTNLRSGEQTTLLVEVNGVQGITSPVPLSLTSGGVITMEGGMHQQLVIKPSEVTDGRYTTTRNITGIQPGGWTATATVEVHRFNVCLRDDSNPSIVVLWNTVTGDYSFSNGAASPANRYFQSAGPSSPSPNDSAMQPLWWDPAEFAPLSKGTVTLKACVYTLEHSLPGQSVTSTIDQCNHTGSASMQTDSPKVRFTIRDRNILDNVCVLQ